MNFQLTTPNGIIWLSASSHKDLYSQLEAMGFNPDECQIHTAIPNELMNILEQE